MTVIERWTGDREPGDQFVFVLCEADDHIEAAYAEESKVLEEYARLTKDIKPGSNFWWIQEVPLYTQKGESQDWPVPQPLPPDYWETAQ